MRDDYTTNIEAAAHEAADLDAYDDDRPTADDLDVLEPRRRHYFEVPVTHEDFAPINPHTFDEEPF